MQLSLASSAESSKPMVRIVRDPALKGDVGVIVQATGATGTPLPSFEATFPAGVDSLSTELDSMYTGAKLQIADASPFPRKCTDLARLHHHRTGDSALTFAGGEGRSRRDARHA